ncbi:MAG: hypothetical protein M3081_12005 [Gemmatimonadota bacterium]|nr:hypothetical protein [Gemmatimonadota bacterium]
MKRLFAVALAAVMLAGCGPRQVEVKTAPVQATGITVRVMNRTNEAANIYINSGGNDIFIGQAQANSTADLPVNGVASGTTVTLRANTNSGTRYSKPNVVLNGTVHYEIP